MAGVPAMILTGELIQAFAGTYLSGRYDHAVASPPFHLEAWTLYASEVHSAGCVAPREHAKSTALTYAYIMAEVCFRTSRHVVLIGSTEDKAAEQLSNISEELQENSDIRRDFGIRAFESETKTEIIVVCDDGHRFRILARGAEQKIRGTIWDGGRPDLIVGDDVEDDEQVESVDRRRKFRNWFFRAAKPALSRHGRIRIHGTILHEDSLLSRLRKNGQWTMLFHQAHAGYSDFTQILWPEQWTEERLRAKQAEFEAEGDAEGYSQEYLNNPLDTKNAYFKKKQFKPMTEEDRLEQKLYYVGCDFAVSKADRANATAFVVGGKDVNGYIHHVDVRCGRWESVAEDKDETGWIDQLFDIKQEWNPEYFFVEDGVVWKAIWPIIRQQMLATENFLNFVPCLPRKDKGIRAGSMQARMKAGACRFDHETDWFGAYQDELLRFQPSKQAQTDDQVDGSAWLHVGLDNLGDVETADFDVADDLEMEEHAYQRQNRVGVSHVTGY